MVVLGALQEGSEAVEVEVGGHCTRTGCRSGSRGSNGPGMSRSEEEAGAEAEAGEEGEVTANMEEMVPVMLLDGKTRPFQTRCRISLLCLRHQNSRPPSPSHRNRPSNRPG